MTAGTNRSMLKSYIIIKYTKSTDTAQSPVRLVGSGNGTAGIVSELPSMTGQTNKNLMLDSNGLMTWGNNSFGYNQAWQDVTASRSINISYTNLTGRPIVVNVESRSGSSIGRDVQIIVNNRLSSRAALSTSNAGVQALVMPGDTYLVSGTIPATVTWLEYR